MATLVRGGSGDGGTGRRVVRSTSLPPRTPRRASAATLVVFGRVLHDPIHEAISYNVHTPAIVFVRINALRKVALLGASPETLTLHSIRLLYQEPSTRREGGRVDRERGGGEGRGATGGGDRGGGRLASTAQDQHTHGGRDPDHGQGSGHLRQAPGEKSELGCSRRLFPFTLALSCRRRPVLSTPHRSRRL